MHSLRGGLRARSCYDAACLVMPRWVGECELSIRVISSLMGPLRRFTTMLTKILVTALVIFACYLFIRYKRGQGLPAPARPLGAAAGVESAPPKSRSGSLALGLCLLSLLASARLSGVTAGGMTSGTAAGTGHQCQITVTWSSIRPIKGISKGAVLSPFTVSRWSIAASERMEISPVLSD